MTIDLYYFGTKKNGNNFVLGYLIESCNIWRHSKFITKTPCKLNDNNILLGYPIESHNISIHSKLKMEAL